MTMPAFTCVVCGTGFSRKDAMKRHMKKQHEQPGKSNASADADAAAAVATALSETTTPLNEPVPPAATENLEGTGTNNVCQQCGKSFTVRKSLLRHEREAHNNDKKAACGICARPFARIPDMKKHMETHTRKRPIPQMEEEATSAEPKRPRRKTRCTQTALNNALRTHTLYPQEPTADAERYLRSQLRNVRHVVQDALEDNTGVKLWMSLKVTFERTMHAGESIEAHFNCRNIVLLRGSDSDTDLLEGFAQILSHIEEFTCKGSGWVATEVSHLDLHLARYQPLRGSSYLPLPDYIANKGAIINVQNEDEQCFKWSILAALHPTMHNPQRLSGYLPYANELNFTGIPFPVSMPHIMQFERQNNLNINVYGLDDAGNVMPLYITKHHGCKHIDLLLITQGRKQHYCLVKSLDRLLSDQRSGNRKKHFCPRCLLPCNTAERKILHMQLCEKHEATRLVMPEDKWLHFKNLHRMQRIPYIMYADFECLTEKMLGPTPTNAASFTQRYQKHTPCGFGVVGVMDCCGGANKKLEKPTIYRGPESVKKFLDTILEKNDAYQTNFRAQHPLNLTLQQQQQHNDARECYLCSKAFKDDVPARDHCHFCGRYRGAAHVRCNMGFRLSRDVVVGIHNLRRYDGHLIMQEIGMLCNEMGLQLDCIPKGMEDYLSFTLRKRQQRSLRQQQHAATNDFVDDEAEEDDDDEAYDGESSWKIRFVDTCQFLTSSLEALVDNLAKEGLHKFPAMAKEFVKAEDLKMLVRKGVYPYDYMDSWERFDEQQLPVKDDFWSQLNENEISDNDYAHAQRVWEHFNTCTLGDYHDLYLKTDVLLLADVFESFRSFALLHYGLDPAHYYTLPSFAWDACLKKTNIWLELLQDPDMYLFFESGIRGGISMISHRYAKANNVQVPNYDPCLPINWLMYLDANNLYGWTMVQRLPIRDFKWLCQEEMDGIVWERLTPQQPKGYVLEVDLEYPESLHDAHNDYPLAPERLQVTPDMLSPYAQSLCETLGVVPAKIEKLVPNLCGKKNYVVHYRNLKLYLSLGMILKRVHRVLSFEQRDWMKPYIMFNTEMRKCAKCDFEKDLFKLLNNAVFGKTMENVRAYQNVQLVTNERKFIKLAAKPRYNRSVIFSEDLVAVNMKRVCVELCKPIYVGFSVLDLSKYLMYDFHYNYIVAKYGVNAKLLFTDTDSLCYNIATNDIYRDMLCDKHLFDTSDYPQTHALHSTQNKKVLGKMKDETAGSPISEFCGLRAKMYSFVCNGVDKKRAKGIKKSVVKKCISHVDYVNTLFDTTTMYHNMNLIRSNLHELYSVHLNKKSLSCYDDKRYLFDDGIESYAYGNCKIGMNA